MKYNINVLRDEMKDGIEELDRARDEYLDYLDYLYNNDLEAYKKEMVDICSDDYGVIIGPRSGAGVIYKYDSGVIGIGFDGRKEEIILDGTNKGHSIATLEIGNLFGIMTDTNVLMTSFSAGLVVSRCGIIIIQLEGDAMLVYLPEVFSKEQYQVLEEEIDPRSNFLTVEFTYDGQICSDEKTTVDDLKRFCLEIINSNKKSKK